MPFRAGPLPSGVDGHLLPDGAERTMRFLAYTGAPTGPTWLRASTLFENATDDLVAATRDRTGAAHLDHVAGLVHLRARTPWRVLRGAVAHVITTAFLHLSWPRPDPAHHLPAARSLLERMRLDDLVRIEAVPVAGEEWMYTERRSCCLAFRAGAHGTGADRYCATCPVTPETDRRSVSEQAAGSYRERTSGAQL